MGTSGTPRLVRVLLVEESRSLRERFRSLIEESGSAEVVGEAGSIMAASFLLHSRSVDAVVLGLHLWDGNGLTVLMEIRRTHSECLVIVLTNSSEPELRAHLLKVGADHVIDRTLEFELVPKVLDRLRCSFSGALPVSNPKDPFPHRRQGEEIQP